MALSPASLIAAALVASAVLAFSAFFLSGRTSQADAMARRLNQYGGVAVATAPPKRVRTGNMLRDLLGAATSAINPMLSRTSASGKLADDLQKADLKLKSSEWVLAVAGVGTLVGVLIAVRFGSPIAFVPCPIAVWVLSGLFLKFRQRRRVRKFNSQLGDTILLLSNALKAGHSFAQALSSVSKNASPPISEEFARATREIALGITVDDALMHMVERNKSEDFDLMVTAVQIQRVVGGNLAEILDTIAFTIRERIRIQGEIRTLTAQARTSGWIITILPFALAGVLALISPGYFGPFLTDPLGHIMIGIGVVSIAIGAAAIQKIVKIEV
ncbi:MAG: type II secretion system F family protein [Candidatus Dormibacteria bacterium]